MYLIIGASSFIGKHLYEYCKRTGMDVLGTYYTHADYPEWIKFDIGSDDLNKFCFTYLNGKVPDTVIVCGANGNIDSCKSNEAESYLLNVISTQRILGQADALGVKCVFLSSEAVFDGNKGMYAEEDAVNPVTVYGKQKLQVEQYIIQNIRNYLIFRISRAVGSKFGEKDIFHEFYNRIVQKKEIVCLKDQSFCLTEVHDIVYGIRKALEHNLTGLYHLSSENYISRYHLAQIYCEKVFGGYGKIAEKSYIDMHFLDNRHIFGGLNGSKLKQRVGINYKSVSEILDKYLETFDKDIFVEM